ncbi:MAG TPA: hypothetical protein VFX16_02935 [Pseudonocardiaceae bacterium]|nr:hypothetical protein [Pseudonocardiaceae bacterium]
MGRPKFGWGGGNDWKVVVEARLLRAEDQLAFLGVDPVRDDVVRSLDVVRDVLYDNNPLLGRLPAWWSGWRVERSWRALHEAEALLTAADPTLAARLPAIRGQVALALAATDTRRVELEKIAAQPTSGERAVVLEAVRATLDFSDDAHAAARALRNKLFIGALLLFGLNTLLGIVGFVRPGFLPMCVDRVDAPGHLICASGSTAPSPADVWLTQVMGATGAVVSTVVLLIRRRPSLTPYVMIGYQAVIKVVLGASLAVIGVLVLGAGLGEGLIGLRDQAAVLVAAVVFGYTQQLGTRLLDNYADKLLDEVRPLPKSESA